MKVLSTMSVKGRPDCRIELWQGDLADFGPEEAVDALVVSAFPDDYTPTPGSLIGALSARGLSVGALANDKDLDIRATHSCWLSKPLTPSRPALGFGRVIGFEPEMRGEPPELVGDIFRALDWILAVRPGIRSVAMPIVAAGDAGYPIATMLSPLLAAARPWLELGLGLNSIAIAALGDESGREALRVFEAAKSAYVEPAAPVTSGSDFDVFVSYSHVDSATANSLVSMLRELRPACRVFLDREALEVGGAWQEEIYESIERSRYVVALLSPAYLSSKPCKDEFGIARLHGDRLGRKILLPVYAFDADLPTRMLYVQFLDAREGDLDRLRDAAISIARLHDAT